MCQDEEHQPVDIDIALDDMLGREFADHLNDYLQGHGRETVSVGVVFKNPEKSKHLETATMKVGSFWIDFVNLRAEEYTQDSRIPDLMRIGTPAEDAFRRDLTINALFYNINTGHVEDWTGRGFDDLRTRHCGYTTSTFDDTCWTIHFAYCGLYGLQLAYDSKWMTSWSRLPRIYESVMH